MYVVRMLQISTTRPSAMYLLEEFSRNFQITHSCHYVQTRQDFHETQQSPEILGVLTASL